MKLVTAIVRPEKFPQIKTALEEYGIQGMTVQNVHGYGQQRGHTEVYRGAEYTVDLLEKTRIEILIEDAEAQSVVGVLVSSANTGRAGDGKVWVVDVTEVVRVRTGERDDTAI
ncbi:P-II family nitrogen regulator [Kocuria coralli]|uniref:Nitrogen regulatory protein P-II n=1 Tax=Kocuria coralli TaxID=1461025 RepID=A0A5J5L188_9MICC|nr:P-II family nitrogen regulator [Kocuria coralli]KAA9395717.1 P-II family nitrogen regulator [Kocuria coralli]